MCVLLAPSEVWYVRPKTAKKRLRTSGDSGPQKSKNQRTSVVSRNEEPQISVVAGLSGGTTIWGGIIDILSPDACRAEDRSLVLMFDAGC